MSISLALLIGSEVVASKWGPVRGERTENGWSYRGIPFAAPPVGALRWQPPQAPAAWTLPREANRFSPPCPQTERDEIIGSEDCLYLNVWSPWTPGSDRLPVMVFIHGGGNMQGSAGKPLYDGALLAERGRVVLVTIQYRLGVLGYLANPALGLAGNYGLLDQQFALEWVRDNIENFGGDPGRVMLFGESAGAVNTCLQLLSPRSQGLFHRALMQSGGCVAAPMATAQRQAAELAGKLRCATAECLRDTPVEKLLEAGGGSAGVQGGLVTMVFSPVVDGVVIPDEPARLLEKGVFHRVPLIIGANADETSALGVPLTVSGPQYTAFVRQTYGPLAERVLALYPLTAFPSPRAAMVAVTSDPQFICPSRRVAQAVAGHEGAGVFRYFFTHAAAPPLAAMGAFHGLELAYLFQRTGDARLADHAVERAMLGYWTSFAANGEPTGTVAWPRYEPVRDVTLEIAAQPSVLEGVRRERCDFWDSLVATRR